MASVVELKSGENPPETPYCMVQVEPARKETLHGFYTFGSVRHTPSDPEEIEREIRHAQREADELGRPNVYVRRQG